MTDATLPTLKTLPPSVRVARPMDRLDSLERIIDDPPGRHALFRGAAQDIGRTARFVAARSLSRNQLAAGAVGGRGTPPGGGPGHARPHGGRHRLDRPPHQWPNSRDSAPGGPDRGRRLRGFWTRRPGRRGPAAGSLDEFDGQSIETDAADHPAVRADAAARPARGRTCPPTQELAHGSQDERPAPRQTVSAQAGRPDARRRPPATGDHRGADEAAPLPRPHRAAAARALRARAAPRRCRPPGRPFVPACQGRSPSSARRWSADHRGRRGRAFGPRS